MPPREVRERSERKNINLDNSKCHEKHRCRRTATSGL